MDNGVGASFGRGVRLITECLPNQLVVLKAVARVHWHFLGLPRDWSFLKIDFHPNLLEEDSSNDEVMSKGLFIDDAFHSFAFAG